MPSYQALTVPIEDLPLLIDITNNFTTKLVNECTLPSNWSVLS